MPTKSMGCMRDKYHVLMLTALSEGRVATQAFTKREVKFLAFILVRATVHPKRFEIEIGTNQLFLFFQMAGHDK